MFGHLVIPEKLKDICFSVVPDNIDAIWGNKHICLTGAFSCAPGTVRRVDAMQGRLAYLNIQVTENWTQLVNILIVGGRAKQVTFKIKKAIEKGIPIIREQELLDKMLE